jgi:hypothetical protein
MIGFIATSLQLQLIITAHTLNYFLMTSVLRISPKNLSLLSGARTGLEYFDLSILEFTKRTAFYNCLRI